MTLRTGHGNGAGVPRVEVLPVDELPAGVQVPEQATSTGERSSDGKWIKGARADQAKGGHSRAGATRLARRMGLASVNDDPGFAPYRRAAADFRRAHVTTLARTIGGGHCGPAPASIIASAAWQLAASRYLFDTAKGDANQMATASKLANDSRQNLLAAHELCAKEALARKAAKEQATDGRELFGARGGTR